ncbi:F-box/kelch-repeat protein At3g23880-like [Papaver somniferum]|uniref:F-box/kelch-repeat protein At3g23880-like n=1 Tax=Papaver somniferum TaxID=3469 RepID=UPI000E6FB13A|nr:F-box/kelch-repeat protein At3g23880-like [Papaver somniferum]
MSISNLLEEIQVEILIKLPVNSISICRCVCKFWYTLLNNPRFIKNQLIRSNNNPRLLLTHSRYWSGKDPKIYSIDYDSILSPPSSSVSLAISCEYECNGAVKLDYPFINEPRIEFQLLGSCDGLVSFGVSSGTLDVDQENSICIWNPSIGEYKKISMPFSDFIGGQEWDWKCNARYGIGYDCIVDDYKLVRIGDSENSGRFQVEVYTLGLDSWKTVEFICYSFRHGIRRFPGVLLNGTLHWLGISVVQELSYDVIVCFDISNERLIEIQFPEGIMTPQVGGEQESYHINLGVLGDRLCLAVGDVGVEIEMWVMQKYGERRSWTKQFTTTQLSMTQYSFIKPIWSYENGEILIDTCKDLILYDPKCGGVRVERVRDDIKSRNRGSYVESLVSPKSGIYVEKLTTDGDIKKPEQQRLRYFGITGNKKRRAKRACYCCARRK